MCTLHRVKGQTGSKLPFVSLEGRLMLTMPGLLCWEWSLGKAADVHKAAVSSEGWLMLMMLGLMPGEVGSVRQCSVCEKGG